MKSKWSFAVSFLALVIFLTTFDQVAEANPNWKIPLEGGYNYLVSVEYGGNYFKGGYDIYHTDSKNGYYALDFTITSDISNPKVVAPESGWVIQIYSDPANGLGYGVAIDHGGGHVSELGHFAGKPFVTVNKWVSQGQPLGVMGSTGNSTGKHLHWRDKFNGKCLSTVPESRPEPLSGYCGDDLKSGEIVFSDNYFTFSVLKFPNSSKCYLVCRGQLWPIADEETYRLLGYTTSRCGITADWSQVQTVNSTTLAIRSESIISSDGKVAYRVVDRVGPNTCSARSADIPANAVFLYGADGKFHHIQDESTYYALGYNRDWRDVVDITQDLFDKFGEGDCVGMVGGHPEFIVGCRVDPTVAIAGFLEDSGSGVGGEYIPPQPEETGTSTTSTSGLPVRNSSLFGLYKEFYISGGYSYALVEEGVRHCFLDPDVAAEMIGIDVNTLPELPMNFPVSGANVTYAEALNRGWLEPILGPEFASPTVVYLTASQAAELNIGSAGYYYRSNIEQRRKELGIVVTTSVSTTTTPTVASLSFREIRVTDISENSLTLSWSPEPEATEYLVYMFGELIGRTTEISYYVSGLYPYIGYRFQTVAILGNGSFKLSEELNTAIAVLPEGSLYYQGLFGGLDTLYFYRLGVDGGEQKTEVFYKDADASVLIRIRGWLDRAMRMTVYVMDPAGNVRVKKFYERAENDAVISFNLGNVNAFGAWRCYVVLGDHLQAFSRNFYIFEKTPTPIITSLFAPESDAQKIAALIITTALQAEPTTTSTTTTSTTTTTTTSTTTTEPTTTTTTSTSTTKPTTTSTSTSSTTSTTTSTSTTSSTTTLPASQLQPTPATTSTTTGIRARILEALARFLKRR
ncbi:MAG: peptidoglycan DD-metalloendopeptidase family protein [Patescibacteria group bacterium]|nr:peptidoglycan DD-metalloendopeptidase family protein [Patescibacteria group bacterium]MDD4611222.1 peptidoglycan DD-metalloendopeptidase family protein [Patescibacteria group bacterium]